MTTKELNRDCKRLIATYKKDQHADNVGNLTETFIEEFKRIYYADKEFKYLSAKNVLNLYALNRLCRIVPFHQFGIYYEID